MRIKRVRRGCYDKYHRCPGWIGGGSKYPKDHKVVCDGGSLARIINYDSKWWRWKFHVCPQCNTLVLPYNQRWTDPTWIWWYAKMQYNDWKYNREWDKR